MISKKPYAIGLEWSSSLLLHRYEAFKVGLNSLNSFATQNGRSRDPNLDRDPLFADLWLRETSRSDNYCKVKRTE